MKSIVSTALLFSFLICQNGYSATDVNIKDRKPFSKTIRTRMPPQIVIEQIQAQFNAMSTGWGTSWQNFVIEDDPASDEFVIIARSVEKPWAFSLSKKDCPQPENYNQITQQITSGGTPVQINIPIGVKKNRSWFRYTVTVYDPMYLYWKNPCYIWNLPPGKAGDKFYNKNYNMEVYAKNLREQVYDVVKNFSEWKPPKKITKIAAMKGAGQELIGGNSDELLTEEEKKLPIAEQEKILERKQKESTKQKKKR